MLLKKNFWVIFVLGMAAGLPLALVLSTLKAVLVEFGFGIELIGLFSLVALPYSIKFIVAPIFDGFLPPVFARLGRRKSWIVLLQILLAVAILLLGFSFISPGQNIGFIAFLAFLVAAFSASQDVVIDAYRIELFKEEDLGLSASFYIFGYRVGVLISGALALFLADILSWQVVFAMMAGFMTFFAGFSCFIGEKKAKIAQKYDFLAWLRQFLVEPLLDFTKKKGWLVILLLIVSFKLSDAFAGSLSLPFFLDLGFSKGQIAGIVKSFGLFATLFGVFCGGFLVKKISIYKALFLAIIIQGVSNLAFAYLAVKGNEIGVLYGVIFVENFSGGIGDAVFVAYLSMLCNIRFSATQYAILSSFAGLSRAVFASSAGVLVAKIGWIYFFVFSAALLLVALLFLALIDKKNA